MEITVAWVVSQILTVIEYGLLAASYLAKKRKTVVILDIVSMTCGIIAFLLLGADLGMAMSIIILLANFYYLWEESSSRITSSNSPVCGSSTLSTASLRASNSSRTSSKIASSRKAKEKRKRERQEMVWRTVVLIVVLVGIGVVTVLTYDGPLSLLSVAATTLYEISIWQKSTKIYKLMGIPVAFCWMTYNGFVRSPFGVLCEAVMLVTSIVGYVREVKTGKRKPVKKT